MFWVRRLEEEENFTIIRNVSPIFIYAIIYFIVKVLMKLEKD